MKKAKSINKIFMYSRNDLRQAYNIIVKSAQKAYEKEKYNECSSYIKAASRFQYNFNDIYSDRRLNMLIEKLADKLSIPIDLLPKDDVVCFIDSFSRDQHGLTQQYLDALFELKTKKIVFISENKQIGTQIKRDLVQNKAKIYILNNKDVILAAREISDIVQFECPSAIFFHLTPCSIAPLLATCKLQSVKRCQINLTDHAFWLGGNTFFNYSFEFRRQGCLISKIFRGFNEKQLVLLPYYPWVEGAQFRGFPIKTDGKIILFSGGALYKTEGKGDVYFAILKAILDRYPNVVFFYAGGGDKTHFYRFIKENSYEEKVFLIGYRDDINEVMKHSDIYLSTYPLFGALMSQFAALNGIPILAYDTYQLEDVVCTKKEGQIVFGTVKELLDEADKLINDSAYRQKKGDYLKTLIASKTDFRECFKNWITEKKVTCTEDVLPFESYDADTFCMQYVDRINMGSMRLNIELSLLRRCPRALSMKMWLNLLLNLPEVLRIEIEREKYNNALE